MAKKVTKVQIKRKKERQKNFIFKTTIDGLLAGLLAIGIFLGRPSNPKPIESYYVLLGLVLFVGFIMVMYAYTRRKMNIAYGLFVVLGVALTEVVLIGVIFQETPQDIMIALFIITPSVLIFDKLLG
ncbi:hypothetical protein LCGC14_0603430 [marine sediment metagenome]|uniref:Uncharacterized protein n=1 Tax=marine sediment metagenome TaxID=412755 RepID=A0A0F9UII0_9ZZZZ